MKKDSSNKGQRSGAGQSEREKEIASRARLTASLRELRLKRDAEIAAAGVPESPPKRMAKKKAS